MPIVGAVVGCFLCSLGFILSSNGVRKMGGLSMFAGGASLALAIMAYYFP